MKIFGMITTSASLAYTVAAIKSFFRHTPLDHEDRFYLIDNDKSFDIGESCLPGQMFVIKNDKPCGFAENVNQVIGLCMESKADLFFLNNDLILTKEWITPLLITENSILSPLTNREVQYATSVVVAKTRKESCSFITKMSMQLEEWDEAALDFIAETHKRNASGYWPVYVLPFCCVKIPFSILNAVGMMDESFGRGGGEDYDYCLRAYMAGFDVRYALNSYILHFMGKSSWSGVETETEQIAREEVFRNRFAEKWGTPLSDAILKEKAEIFQQAESMASGDAVEKLRNSIAILLGNKEVKIRLQ